MELGHFSGSDIPFQGYFVRWLHEHNFQSPIETIEKSTALQSGLQELLHHDDAHLSEKLELILSFASWQCATAVGANDVGAMNYAPAVFAIAAGAWWSSSRAEQFYRDGFADGRR